MQGKLGELSGLFLISSWITVCNGRKKRPLPAVRAAKGPNPSHFPSLKRRKPMRRPARLPQWRNSSVLHPGLEQRRVILLILFFLLCPVRHRMCVGSVFSVSIQRYQCRLEMLGWRCRWQMKSHWLEDIVFKKTYFYFIRGIKIVETYSFVYKIYTHRIYLDVLFFVLSVFEYWFTLLCLISSLSIPYQKWLLQVILKLSKREVFWKLERQLVSR